jgi:hypothetical protein
MATNDEKQFGILQLNDTGPRVDQDTVKERMSILFEFISALDGGKPSPESLVAVAALKGVLERAIGFNVDVGIRPVPPGVDVEKVRADVKEEYERTGQVPDSRPVSNSPTDPTVH